MNTSANQPSAISTPVVDVYSGGPTTLAYITAVQAAALAWKRIQWAHKLRAPDGWSRLSIDDIGIIDGWNWTNCTFRVDPSDRPKKIVPLDVSDFGATTWVRGLGIYGEQMVVSVHPNGCICLAGGQINGDGMNLYLKTICDDEQGGTHEYSTDRKVWRPTHKEITVD